MTKKEALKLKPGDKIEKVQTGEIYEFLEFVTYVLKPPMGDSPVVFAKLLAPDGRFEFQQPQDMGPFELVKDDS